LRSESKLVVIHCLLPTRHNDDRKFATVNCEPVHHRRNHRCNITELSQLLLMEKLTACELTKVKRTQIIHT